jgi:uncharacterized SAM-binding protein YcdF (DUF218 family)
MFFLDKLIWAVLNPGNVLALCLFAGVILYLLSRGRRGKALVALATLGFTLLTVAPVGPATLWALEKRFPSPEALPERVDGIVVLGGAVNSMFEFPSGVTAANCSAVRVIGAIALARRYPAAKLVLVGSGVFPIGYADARATLRFVGDQGIAPTRVLLEEKSRTTHENVGYAKELVQPSQDQTWVLVTSAYHMPRAMGAFTAAGWRMIPYPTDFSIDARTELRAHFSLLDGLNDSSLAAHEWGALVLYRLMGWTRELFPAPAGPTSTG